MERNGGNVKSEAANPPRMKGRPAPHSHCPSSAPRTVRPGRAPSTASWVGSRGHALIKMPPPSPPPGVPGTPPPAGRSRGASYGKQARTAPSRLLSTSASPTASFVFLSFSLGRPESCTTHTFHET